MELKDFSAGMRVNYGGPSSPDTGTVVELQRVGADFFIAVDWDSDETTTIQKNGLFLSPINLLPKKWDIVRDISSGFIGVVTKVESPIITVDWESPALKDNCEDTSVEILSSMTLEEFIQDEMEAGTGITFGFDYGHHTATRGKIFLYQLYKARISRKLKELCDAKRLLEAAGYAVTK